MGVQGGETGVQATLEATCLERGFVIESVAEDHQLSILERPVPRYRAFSQNPDRSLTSEEVTDERDL